jgi:membrane protein
MKRILDPIKYFYHLNVRAITNLINHDGVEHAGYMAFITILSFFPFLIFLMAVTGFIGKSDHGRELIYLIINTMPIDLIGAIKPRIDEIMVVQPSGLLTISILGIIWTSSSAVEGIRTILNKIYNVESPPAYVWRRLLSILQFFIITAILIISMFILLLFPMIYEEISHIRPLESLFAFFNNGIFAPIWDNARHFTLVLTLFAGVMFLYKNIPNTPLRFRSVIPGAILVSILWIISGSLLSQYIYQFSQLNLVYGSLAGFIITLLFFYIIHIIFIYGAEINRLLDKTKITNVV